MKKFLVLSIILMMSAYAVAKAADNSTYSDKLFEQYTKNLTETEMKLREQQAARDAAIEKKRQERYETVSKKLQEIENRNQQTQNEFSKKIEEINKQAEQNRAEINKKIEAQNKAIEEAKKQAETNSNVRKEKINKKRQLLKELMSE